MKFLSLFLTFFIGLTLLAQNPDGFDKMAKNMAGKKAPIITKAEVDKLLTSKKNVVFLDSREQSEYQTSHLPEAMWVGFDNINWTKIDKLDKSTPIVVYCSVGYRSGKLTEQLAKKGFTNVKNLYGGLFNWANNGGALQNDMKIATKDVHGYNKNWSKWLNPTRVNVVL
jgi:rhodanese-related sulfurtransferase|tara:strand:+ start:78497 stop:79003 length:507 start_codon:yes stop_codon:yes gene_type:complete